MTNDEIEKASFEALEHQKKISANVRASDGDWTTAEEDSYTMGFETGARWALARLSKYTCHKCGLTIAGAPYYEQKVCMSCFDYEAERND